MINEFSEEDIRRLKELVDSSKTERFMVGHILKKSFENNTDSKKQKE